MKTFNEFVSLSERPLTKGEEDKKEDIVKGMKKDKKGFEDRYGDDAKSVMYATATKLAKEDVTLQDANGNDFLEVVDLIKPDPIKGVATEQNELEPKEKPEPTVDQEPSKENQQIKKKEKKVNMMKRQILMKKMQAVRSGAGGDIVAHHEPEGEMVEGLVSMVKKGAKRHAKAVEKKKIKDRKAVPYAALGASYEPEGEELKEYSPNVTYQAKGGKKSGKLGKSSVYSLKDKGESKKEFRKSQVKDIKGGYLKTEEVGCETKKIENKGKKKIDPNKNPVVEAKVDEGAAWTKKAGKNPEGGLNEKGRKSYERENPGSDLKAPQPEGGSRKKSFCARMGGMKKKLTSSKTANDPDSRINKALRKWKC